MLKSAPVKPNETLPQLRPMPEGAWLAIWTVYDHPVDFPQGYVLRPQYAMQNGTIAVDHVAWFADDPDKLRAIMPFGLTCVGRAATDDPAILEVWI